MTAIIDTYKTPVTVVKNVRNTIIHAGMLVTSSQEQIGTVNEPIYAGGEETVEWIFDDFFFQNRSGYVDSKYENRDEKELHKLTANLHDDMTSLIKDILERLTIETDGVDQLPLA